MGEILANGSVEISNNGVDVVSDTFSMAAFEAFTGDLVYVAMAE
jgi:hypothetical protein